MYCYHFDATDHTVAMTDSSKAIINAYAYTPFGNISNQQEDVDQPFKFVGEYGVMTEDNGWYYMRARFYDPETHIISEDPMGFDGGDVNLYAYASNNPVMFIDPL
jgi:RHS repeat-associated protein